MGPQCKEGPRLEAGRLDRSTEIPLTGVEGGSKAGSGNGSSRLVTAGGLMESELKHLLQHPRDDARLFPVALTMLNACGAEWCLGCICQNVKISGKFSFRACQLVRNHFWWRLSEQGWSEGAGVPLSVLSSASTHFWLNVWCRLPSWKQLQVQVVADVVAHDASGRNPGVVADLTVRGEFKELWEDGRDIFMQTCQVKTNRQSKPPIWGSPEFPKYWKVFQSITSMTGHTTADGSSLILEKK
ncbi:hypothetical protein EYF80_004046 [Liparis tanakae]|uniref:Uncharacterized protein n=1 Tax=Liparis tanakae TaxID=230148 RepID=A0A4Z2J6I2_9TELE|nr:hypothetical protein EYF80_004046 [Liparis tanakae]